MKSLTLSLALAALLLLPTRAGEAGEAERVSSPAAIQWFGTWEQGLAEARRTGRPILLTAAAPQCRGISGIW